MEDRHQTSGTQGKGHGNAGHGHGDRLGADGDQLIEVAFQAREEEQGKEAQGGHRLQAGETLVVDLTHKLGRDIREGTHQLERPVRDCCLGLRRDDQMQARSANDHAGDQLAKDGGQLPAHQQFRQQACRHKNHQEATDPDQGFDHFELMGADLRHSSRE